MNLFRNDLQQPLEVGTQLPPGALLIVTVKTDVAISIELVGHFGAVATANGFECTTAYSKWLAWYSPDILANGWQPYNQPLPAAYVPLGFNDMDMNTSPCFGGLLLRQKRSAPREKLRVSESAFLISCSSDAVPSTLAQMLTQAGVPADAVDRAVDFLHELGTPMAIKRGIDGSVSKAQERLSRLVEVTLAQFTETTEMPRDALEPGLSMMVDHLLKCGEDIVRETRMTLLTELAEQLQQIYKDTSDSGFSRAADIIRREARYELTEFQSLVEKLRPPPESP